MRRLTDPRVMMATAAELLGRYLKANRCGYGEIEDNGEFVSTYRDWTDGTMPEAPPAAIVSTITDPALIADLRAARTVRLVDSYADPRTQGDATAAHVAVGGMRGSIAVPLIKGGHLAALLYVNQATPRQWTAEEEALAGEVAQRTWEAVERARSDAALRVLNATLEQRVAERSIELQASEARLRSIFESSYQLQGLLAPDGTLLDANATSLAVIDAKFEDVVGKPFWDTPWFTGTPGMPETRP